MENQDPRTSERIKRNSMDAFIYPNGEYMERGDIVKAPSIGTGRYVIIGWAGTDSVIVIPESGGKSERICVDDIERA